MPFGLPTFSPTRHATLLSPNRWQCASDSHCGNVRAINEDAVLCRPEVGLWAIADGMGGHHAGDYASRAITDALAHLSLSYSAERLADDVDALEDALQQVNEQLRLHGLNECKGKTVGSTVASLLCRGSIGVALWAGDTRVYRLRNSLKQVTRDHNPVSDLLDSGAVSEEEALATDTNVVTRAVGGLNELHLDIAVFDVQPGDVLLLCSDGLYRELSNRELAQALRQAPSVAVGALMEDCLAGPARDNVSIVVIQVPDLS